MITTFNNDPAPQQKSGANIDSSLAERLIDNFTEKFNSLTVAYNADNIQSTGNYNNITGRELWKLLKEPRIGHKNGTHFLRTDLKCDKQGVCLSRADINCTEEGRLIIIDVDETTATHLAIHEALKKADIAHILVGTHSYYAENKNRFRILLLSDSSYSKDQLEPTSEAVVETINCFLTHGFLEYANENKIYAQGWYTPSMPNDCNKEILYLEYAQGQLFPVKDKQLEPVVKQALRPIFSTEGTQISPITAWNNQVPIGTVLQEYGYKHVFKNKNTCRWLSPNSTSGRGGVVEYLGTGRVFSHHNDCLNDGYSHDSFDVMRLLKGLSHDEAIRFASQQTKAPDGRTIDEYNKSVFRKNKPDSNALTEIIFNPYQPFNDDLLPVENIPYEALPEILADFIKEQSLIRGCPADFILVSLLARMGCVFSGKIQIALTKKTDWYASPNFFWAMIGDPSSGKSNALSSTNKPIQLLSKQARDQYKGDFKQYIQNVKILESKIASAKKGMETEAKKAAANPAVVAKFEATLKAYLQDLADLEENKPKLKRYTFSKVTVEKLILTLEENPDGVMLEVDELSSFFVRLSKDDNADERGLYLSGFNGSLEYPYDTVKRGTVFIPRLLLSIFGGIQPSKLKRFLNEARTGYQDDGLLQRFQGVVYPDKHTQKLEDRPQSFFLVTKINELFSNLNGVNGATLLHLDETAQQLFDQWRNETAENAQSLGHPFEAYLVKSYEFVASLAVYLYLAENNGLITPDKLISTKQILSAIKLGHYFFSHAKRMYGLVYKDNLPARSLSKKLIKLTGIPALKTEHFDSNNNLFFFTRSQIRAKDWADLTTQEERREAINVLIQMGHISKPSNNKYYINPDHLNE
ncbi:DUF3987 domain-containing protein [Legionella fairfieldensis]|uniref:DUF3987 domain-containing protein n=1 Tax=Legionella fairfieldensis TaxID=45064 RepID=UPI00048A64CE|nr:DUF3987 domain-containing protein [Legionella fairfieldensis]